jgi:uncharacterized protein (TIGR00369 family)
VKVLNLLQQGIRDGSNPVPLGALMGFRCTAAEPGLATVEIEATAEHANPMGRLHGGVLCTIADSAMGIAHACLMDESEVSVSVEIKMNFLKRVDIGKLRAIGSVVRQGNTISFVECEVLDSEGVLVAKASGTYMKVVPRKE